jgi:hypothetical protein
MSVSGTSCCATAFGISSKRAGPYGADDRHAAERPLDVADVGEHLGRDADARGERVAFRPSSR